MATNNDINNLGSGSIVQRSLFSTTTSSSYFANNLLDSATPTTSNTAYVGISTSITPKSTNNILIFDGSVCISLFNTTSTLWRSAGIFIFEGNTLIYSTAQFMGGSSTGVGNNIRFKYYIPAPSTNSLTYAIYSAPLEQGPGAGALIRINNQTSTSYNGTLCSTFMITEVLP